MDTRLNRCYTIQRAEPGDFLAIAALDRTAWRSNRQAEYIPDGEHAWRLWVEHALVFCAADRGRMVGAILAFPTQSGAWVVHKAFVDQSHRGQGLGRRLFEALLAELDGLGVDAFLTVDPENSAAIKLYERMGFIERRFVPGYYRPDEDRLVLSRRSGTGVRNLV